MSILYPASQHTWALNRDSTNQVSSFRNNNSPKPIVAIKTAAPKPALAFVDAIAIIVGIVIGAGIFETPALVAANAESETVLMLVWLSGGAISMVGALCYAELATAYPHAGGQLLLSQACLWQSFRLFVCLGAHDSHTNWLDRSIGFRFVWV